MKYPLVINRIECDSLKKLPGYVLLYGRRKTGKTFLLSELLTFDVYALVKHGGGIHIEGAPVTRITELNQFYELLGELLSAGKKVVVDEFQRLPTEFLDNVQIYHPRGKLVLCGSSTHVARDLLAPRSPVLGLISEVKLGLIRPSDMMAGLPGDLSPDRALELAMYLRDPWSIQYYRGVKTDIPEILIHSKLSIPSLVGECFIEEARHLSQVYEGILRGLAGGKWKLKDIADGLYSRKLIPTNSPSSVRPYFNVMEKMGLVERIKLFSKNKYQYRVASPLIELGYKLDEKYGFFDREVPEAMIGREVEQALGKHVESFLGFLLEERLEGNYEYLISKDYDIDIVITDFQRPICIAEVKWKNRFDRREYDRFLQRTERFDCKRIFIIKDDAKDVPEGLDHVARPREIIEGSIL